MEITWLVKNTKESRGFISPRVQIATYTAICILFGTAILVNHGRTDKGIHIGQILTPDSLHKAE